jgi:U-box domain
MKHLLTECFGDVDKRPDFGKIYDCLAEKIVRTVKLERPSCSDSLICPISFDIMDDPVVCADGHSYDRVNIERWLAASNRSPKTNLPLAHNNLIPNLALKKAVDEYKADPKNKQRPVTTRGPPATNTQR